MLGGGIPPFSSSGRRRRPLLEKRGRKLPDASSGRVRWNRGSLPSPRYAQLLTELRSRPVLQPESGQWSAA